MWKTWQKGELIQELILPVVSALLLLMWKVIIRFWVKAFSIATCGFFFPLHLILHEVFRMKETVKSLELWFPHRFQVESSINIHLIWTYLLIQSLLLKFSPMWNVLFKKRRSVVITNNLAWNWEYKPVWVGLCELEGYWRLLAFKSAVLESDPRHSFSFFCLLKKIFHSSTYLSNL